MTSLQLGLTVTRRIFHSLRLNQAFPQLAAFLRTHSISWRWEESFSLDFLVLTLSLEIANLVLKRSMQLLPSFTSDCTEHPSRTNSFPRNLRNIHVKVQELSAQPSVIIERGIEWPC